MASARAGGPSDHTGGGSGAGLLFAPLRIRGMELPNRIALTAMVTRLSGEDGLVNRKVTDRYVRHAKGGPGLMVLEATAVHGSKSGPLLRMSEDRFIDGHAEMLARIREVSESKVALQIIHFLKLSRSGWRQRVADLDRRAIGEIPALYAAAAERVKRAGYDAVELHMAHAYTLASFLSRLNRRTDEYGGSLENRLRLPGETLAAVREAVGPSYCVGVRFDGEECIKDGYTVEDAKPIALRLSRLGADYVSLSAGGKFEDAVRREGEPLYPYTGYSGDRTMPGGHYPDLTNIHIASAVRAFLREHGSAAPVVATGKIRTSAQMEAVLGSGQADLVGIARGLLADPDLPRKLRNGREDTVVGCVYANVCKNLDENFREVRCFLWPKGAVDAPLVDDGSPPTWGTAPPSLTVEQEAGRLRLEWSEAADPMGVYGYEIFRAVGEADFESHAKQPAYFRRRWYDRSAVSGLRYRYFVKAYDLAGNRSSPTPVAEAGIGEAGR